MQDYSQGLRVAVQMAHLHGVQFTAQPPISEHAGTPAAPGR